MMMKPMTSAMSDDHHRLQQGERLPDRDLDLVVVGFCDLHQHVVEAPGLLADQDHVDREHREAPGLHHRAAQAAAFLQLARHVADRFREPGVAHGLAHDVRARATSVTPLASSVPSVREKRAISMREKRLPTTGPVTSQRSTR